MLNRKTDIQKQVNKNNVFSRKLDAFESKRHLEFENEF